MRPIPVVLLVLLATACVSVSKTVLTQQFASRPVPREQVQVLLASVGDSMPSHCERVAVLHASGDQDMTNEGKVLDKLREETGKLGGNTVFVQNMEDAGTGERVVGALFGVGADRDAEALALHCPG